MNKLRYKASPTEGAIYFNWTDAISTDVLATTPLFTIDSHGFSVSTISEDDLNWENLDEAVVVEVLCKTPDEIVSDLNYAAFHELVTVHWRGVIPINEFYGFSFEDFSTTIPLGQSVTKMKVEVFVNKLSKADYVALIVSLWTSSLHE